MAFASMPENLNAIHENMKLLRNASNEDFDNDEISEEARGRFFEAELSILNEKNKFFLNLKQFDASMN